MDAKKTLLEAYRIFDGKVGDALLGPYIDDGHGNKRVPLLDQCLRLDRLGARYRELKLQMLDLIDEIAQHHSG